MLKVYLRRNLRRNILRGHPWVYREALLDVPPVNAVEYCQIFDGQKKPVAFGYYSPRGPLAVRVLSTGRKPPNAVEFFQRVRRAKEGRRNLNFSTTNAFRLLNGEGDLLPGLVCDVYNDTAVLQYDGHAATEFWQRQPVGDWVAEVLGLENVVEKLRGAESLKAIRGMAPYEDVIVKENELQFAVNIRDGQKTGFFIDQRENRNYLRAFCKDKTFLNLFSYTGGFSMYAGAGGAASVESVDIAAPAIAACEKNWTLNGLPEGQHQGHAADVESFLTQGEKTWDMIVVDPPSMASSEKQKSAAIGKYTELFTLAARRLNKGGDLFLSSCSSHISFDDFLEITSAALSQARCRGQILRVSGQGSDHPFPHACPELRYLKFVHLCLVNS